LNPRKSLFRLSGLALAVLLVGCAANPAIHEARQLVAEGRSEDGVLRLEQAMRDAPGDRDLRAQYFRERDLATAQLLAQAQAEQGARHAAQAQALYERVQRLDAFNPRARAGLADLQVQRRLDESLRDAQAAFDKGDNAAAERIVRSVLVESPMNPQARQLMQQLRERETRNSATAQALGPAFSKPITLEFRDTPLKTVFEVMARSSGINFVFDKDVRSETKVTIFVRNTGMDEVMRLVLASNQLERKLLNENSVLIYPSTPAKSKQYEELVTRSFYLANADVKQAMAMVRALVKTRDIFADEKLNLLIMKDTPDAVRLAERLVESLDLAEPEVMLDVEVLEITRGKLQELGLRFPDQIGYGLLQPTTSSTIINNGVTETSTNLGGTLAPGYVDLRNRAALTSFVTNPALTLNLRNEAGDGNLLANPRIRVRNREKAKIHIGDKLPVFTTTSTANVGVAAAVSYLDVGLKLEVEPTISLDDEVSIKVGLEVSSIAREIPGPANSLAYQIGTRSAATVLRLRNGETQVLAGLISDEERRSANRLPGLGEIPLIGRLFSSQRDNSNKTEIVLLITPRIVRNLTRPTAESVTASAGSEQSVGAPALQLRKAPPRSVSLSSSPAAAGRLVPQPQPQQASGVGGVAGDAASAEQDGQDAQEGRPPLEPAATPLAPLVQPQPQAVDGKAAGTAASTQAPGGTAGVAATPQPPVPSVTGPLQIPLTTSPIEVGVPKVGQ
jgi:general secretion pathway protein D